jgi:7,8-dihydro-6-hydroxymethylpterin-pyrophosphokinase
VNSTAAKAGRILVVLALLASIGAHWALLRSVAWTQMLVERTQQGSFSEAVKTTFDGEHPCGMCQAIEQEQRKERQQDGRTMPKVKLDVIVVNREITIAPPEAPHFFPETAGTGTARAEQPALPPPRRA